MDCNDGIFCYMSEKIKLLHYTSTFLPTLGGAQFFIKYLAEELQSQNNVSQVFISSTVRAETYLENVTNVTSFNIKETDTSKRVYRIIYNLKNEIKDHKPKVILCHSAYIDLFVVVLASFLAFEFPKIIVVSHGNDLGKDERSGYGVTRSLWKSLLIKFLLRSVCKIICPSDFQKSHAMNYVSDETRLCVIPNGIKMTPTSVRKKSPEKGQVNLILMSSARPVKQLAFALSNILSVARKHQHFNIFVTCEDETITSSALDEYSKYGVQEQLHLIGHISGEQKMRTLSRMDVLLLPSLYENCPITILESFQNNIIPVASRTGGIPELITHKETGLLFDPINGKEMNKNLEMLLKSPDLCKTILHNVSCIRDDYRIQNVTKKYTKVVEEVSK